MGQWVKSGVPGLTTENELNGLDEQGNLSG